MMGDPCGASGCTPMMGSCKNGKCFDMNDKAVACEAATGTSIKTGSGTTVTDDGVVKTSSGTIVGPDGVKTGSGVSVGAGGVTIPGMNMSSSMNMSASSAKQEMKDLVETAKELSSPSPAPSSAASTARAVGVLAGGMGAALLLLAA